MKIRDFMGHRWLDCPEVYCAFQRLITSPGSTQRFVDQWVRPFPGCTLLDVGCGPGRLMPHLPMDIGRIIGLDHDAGYIENARKLYGHRAEFLVADAGQPFPVEAGTVDVVMTVGVLHHLNDESVQQLMKSAHLALKPGGVFVSCDPVFIPHQHPVAEWFLKRDRGKFIRQPDGYLKHFSRWFDVQASKVEHDHMRVPYDHFLMRGRKKALN
jgi:SAM-dependent methyltransferase